VPADGYFEWQATAHGKQPFLFRRPDGEPFVMAGLWECWTAPDGSTLETCALLTTEANTVVRPVHERMPVLLGLGDFGRWLDPSAPPADLLSLLRPAPEEALTATPVSAFVNSARHEGPGCIEPLKEPSPLDHPE
jgi:putative SOS response-associated peptidase YedK